MTKNLSHRPHRGAFADPSRDVVLGPECTVTLQELVAVARGDGRGNYATLRLDGDWEGRCLATRSYIEKAMQKIAGLWDKLVKLESPEEKLGLIESAFPDLKGKLPRNHLEQSLLIYGVFTGFGNNKDKPLKNDKEIRQLQVNILRSHAAGSGRPLPTEVVRAIMLLRVRTFIEGYSGVRPEIVRLLVDMLNEHVHPWVPEQGSVGSSGDLCPLAHLSLVLIGEGHAWVDDAPSRPTYTMGAHTDLRVDTRPAPLEALAALEKKGLKPLWANLENSETNSDPCLEAKEGLALVNGAAMCAALTALAVYDADMLLGTANFCGATSLQALLGLTRAFDSKVQTVRRHDGQKKTAAQVLSFATGSKLLNKTDDVQDPYSLRCIPQVHGAAMTAIDHAWDIMLEEINAVTDNPLFFIDTKIEDMPDEQDQVTSVWKAFSAGNYHGEPVGMVADYLKIAVAELASISERRTQLLLDPNHNRGLPGNLSGEKPGLNSGLMIAQYAAAGLVSENKVLAHPASVDSIPTSSNAEDHVAMSSIAARHAREVVANSRNVLAIELLTAMQALEERTGGDVVEQASRPVANVHKHVRDSSGIDFIKEDRELWNLIAILNEVIASGDVLSAALGK